MHSSPPLPYPLGSDVVVEFVLPLFVLSSASSVTFQNRTTKLQQSGLDGLDVMIFSVNQSSNAHSTTFS